MSKSVAKLDAILNHVTGYDREKVVYISWGNNMFGTCSAELLTDAKTKLEGWFPAPIGGSWEET
jgi:hypothetical protein